MSKSSSKIISESVSLNSSVTPIKEEKEKHTNANNRNKKKKTK